MSGLHMPRSVGVRSQSIGIREETKQPAKGSDRAWFSEVQN